jgi:hypothetical protein
MLAKQRCIPDGIVHFALLKFVMDKDAKQVFGVFTLLHNNLLFLN